MRAALIVLALAVSACATRPPPKWHAYRLIVHDQKPQPYIVVE